MIGRSNTPINLGNLVLRRAKAVVGSGEHDKLTTNWGGPYKVIEQVRTDTY